MNYYCDITLLPDAEASLGFLWQKIFRQVHLALVEQKQPDGHSVIAVSFPQYGQKNFPLGKKLRLLANTEAELNALDLGRWLNRLSDYCHSTSIKPVKRVNKYVRFKRKQFKSNLEKVAQRRAAYKNERLEESRDYVKEHYDEQCDLPFINIVSESSNPGTDFLDKDKFKLFVIKEEAEQPEAGYFDCYGLSKTATVPWF